MKHHPDIRNLEACTCDVTDMAKYQIAMIKGEVEENIPEDITNLIDLLDKLASCHHKLPVMYFDSLYEPYIKCLNAIGEVIIPDFAQAIIQNGGCYKEREKETDAFHEMIFDLFAGFLSQEDREGVKNPDYLTIAPLPKWGMDFPYTVTPADPEAWRNVGFKTTIVNLPLANADRGLLTWAALPHETGGHDILSSDEGLIDELRMAVKAEQEKEGIGSALSNYWSPRIEETGADVLGILNMGPAVAIAMIGLLRGLNAAGLNPLEEVAKPVLSNRSPSNYPADLLRGYLAAYTTGKLSFEGAKEWEEVLLAETDKDLNPTCKIEIDGELVGAEDIKRSVAITAETISRKPMSSLENHYIGEIQDWHDHDEEIVNENLRPILAGEEPLLEFYPKDTYATHAVAAGVIAALAGDAKISTIFGRMKDMLKTMHNTDPTMSPLTLAKSVSRAAWRIRI
jgi:hypothetical protein